jgi:hypothetical protein
LCCRRRAKGARLGSTFNMPSFCDGRRAVGTLMPSAAAVFGQCGLAKREEPSEKRSNDTNDDRDSGNDRSVLCGSGDLARVGGGTQRKSFLLRIPRSKPGLTRLWGRRRSFGATAGMRKWRRFPRGRGEPVKSTNCYGPSKVGRFLTLYRARRTRPASAPTEIRTNRTGALTPRSIAISSICVRSASVAAVSASLARASDTITSPPRH